MPDPYMFPKIGCANGNLIMCVIDPFDIVVSKNEFKELQILEQKWWGFFWSQRVSVDLSLEYHLALEPLLIILG